MPDHRPSILITGASGGLAGILVDMLTDDFRLVGVDPRPMPAGRNFPGVFHQVDYTHRRMAEIFRRTKFEALIHLGRIRASDRASANTRYKTNVLGTRNLLDLSRRYGVGRLIVFSTYHVYGAHIHNHVHIREHEPLRASQTFPELVDAIELDHAATTFMWQHREVRTLILRPVNVVGARINNTITQLLRGEVCPKLLGFDPLMQFIHEKDIARALRLSLDAAKSGIYNIMGEGAIPWSKAIELAGAVPLPLPHFLVYPVLGAAQRLTNFPFPKHLVDYFRYPTVVDDAGFQTDFGYKPAVSTVDAIRSINEREH